MKLQSKYRVIIINLLIAIAISLIVNFSIFIFRLTPTAPGGWQGPGWMRSEYAGLYQFLQIAYYVILSFILLTIATVKTQKASSFTFLKRVIVCTAVAAVFYFIAPRMSREGDIMIQLNAHRMFDSQLLLKVSFTLVVAVLYGKIYDLLYQKQHIVLENEVLKNENLQTTYNTLINQINPHFFFNSLNSLSMLVREKHNQQALVYIDRLSDTFRYIIQNGQTGGTTLEEELKFMDAYKYLLEIRYEGKLFFEISIDKQYYDWTLPSLTLQPLIENIVKHNTITRANPMTVSISTDSGKLIVSNGISPKIEDSEPTGIGLRNLSQRYLLLTGSDISIENDGKTFSVVLPLGKPEEGTSLLAGN